ncbi:ABC transporter substrate-binding protein [Pseudoclavibacter sp. CFCC 13796]|uniref:ABC transporter substrate-binding protein n=1 Tax=Pseudoclavibacter sp. CFCC 13796 TaxID=2615179 RepID=UPI001300F2FD|nr:ABC transporter substrate-binding protein [Pseudoclavibacter sp. CFCC 13796]KAB1661483.1 ABC transporter substrate-binding protein [Pseudoclavibacter sp. CFCC 13796]
MITSQTASQRRAHAGIRRSMGMGLVAGAAAFSLALSGCSSQQQDSAASDGLDPVSVLLDWTPNPDHVSLYTAQHTGAYEQAGVKVDFTTPSGTADAAKMVSLGQTDLAISYEPDTLIAEGEGLDVISVGALVPTSLNSVMTWEGSGINGPQDLAGKKVGTSGLASQETTMNYIAKKHGVDPSTITYVNLSQGLNQPLIDHQVDATIGAYPNIEGVELAEHGSFPSWSNTELGLPDYDELVVIAQRSRLQSDSAYAERVRKFLAGTAKGQEAAEASTDTAVEALTGPTDGAYDPDVLRRMVERTVPLLKNDGGFGHQPEDDWAAYAAWMHENGLLENEYDGRQGLTNEYLPGR